MKISWNPHRYCGKPVENFRHFMSDCIQFSTISKYSLIHQPFTQDSHYIRDTAVKFFFINKIVESLLKRISETFVRDVFIIGGSKITI